MEAGVIISKGEPLYWHIPPDRSTSCLPDSTELWNQFWKFRHTLDGFAHSHPGSGPVGPSWEDITTFAAVEAALGRRLNWWIINQYYVSLVMWKGPDKCDYQVSNLESELSDCLDWVDDLRKASYGT